MKADLSRGHRPDRKRGEKYRRVLLQQGRLLLDSDVAAQVDAVDTLLRELGRDLGCAAGSPDLGFLVTPGPLFALFDSLDGVRSDPPSEPTGFHMWRDHGSRYLDLFPSLYISSAKAEGAVTIGGRRSLSDTSLRIWARIPLGVSLGVKVIRAGGASVTSTLVNQGSNSDHFQPYDVSLSGGSFHTIELTVTAPVGTSPEAWIGLIEGLQKAGEEPVFWVTGGRFHLAGLPLEIVEDASFPGVSFPDGPELILPDKPPSLSSGDRLVTFVEGWERHVTHVEDRGILEQGLGGSVDTCTRTTAVGQVKVAACSGEVKPEDILAVFRAVETGRGTLVIETNPEAVVSDPCAIPEVAGYAGGENRLYRFEVHDGGDLGVVLMKWSRNNGADLFRVAEVDGTEGTLTLAPGADVRDGDILEFLTESIDLGDHERGEITLAQVEGTQRPVFRPPTRAVGVLYYAQEIPSGSARKVRLLDLATKKQAKVAGALAAQPGPKVRRWHGLLRTAPASHGAPPQEKFVVDGIAVALGGERFQPGDYWQFEARKLHENANGPWVKTPHGPERLFAPLALLTYKGGDEPVALERWYSEPFSSLCDLSASDIAYDGAKAGTKGNATASTVQEALDELYLRHDDGCCYVNISPVFPVVDDTARLQTLIDAMPDGGVICLRPGVYHLQTKLIIAGKRIELQGCPDAVLVAEAPDDPMIEIGEEGSLLMSELVACSKQSFFIIQAGHKTASFSARECGFVLTLPAGFNDIIPAFVSYAEMSSSSVAPQFDFQRCVIVAPMMLSTSWLQSMRMHECICYCRSGGSIENVGNLELKDSVVDLRLEVAQLEELKGLEPAAMAKRAIEMVNVLEAPSSGPYHGICIQVQQKVMGGIISRCSFVGGHYALTASEVTDVHLEGNTYWVNSCGVALLNAERCSIHNERINSQGTGIKVALKARDLRISGCLISGPRGVVLAEPEDSDRELFDVHVCENRIEASTCGIRIGNKSNSSFLLARIQISDNTVMGGDECCIHVVAGDTRAWGAAANVKITNNRIQGDRIGLYLIGYGLDVIGNHVALDNPQPTQYEDNKPAGILLKSVECAFVKDNCVIVANCVTDDASAVRLISGFAARLIGNWLRTHSDRDIDMYFINANGHQRMLCSENTCLSRSSEAVSCVFVGAHYLTFDKNSITGDVYITDTWAGTITSNRLDDNNGSQNIIITGAEDDWQILDNVLEDGDIQILPKVLSSVFLAPSGPPPVRPEYAAAPVRRPATGGRFINTDSGAREPSAARRMADRGGASFASVAARDSDEVRPVERGARVRAADARAAEGSVRPASRLVSEAIRFVEDHVASGIRDIISDFEANLTTSLSEYSYTVQVRGNNSMNLYVGYIPKDGSIVPGDKAKPNDSSKVLVLGNIVQSTLRVNKYKNAVVANNIAQVVKYPPQSPPPIFDNNLNV